MKIAQVVCTFPPYKGGIGKVAFDYAKAVSQYGDEVVVFTPKYNKNKENYPFQVKRLFPVLKYGNAAFLPQLFFHLLFGKFDIVHLHYPFFGTMEVIFLLKKIFPKKFKLVIHYHMNVVGLPWHIELMRLPAKLVEKSLFNLAEKITCASMDYIENNNPEIFLPNKDKFIEIPFGVDTEIFKPGKNKKKQILFVGGMDKAHYFKGVRILLKAYSQIKTAYNLVLVGAGELQEDYKKYAKNLKISNKISFVGDLKNSELIKLYQDSALLVLPSINSCEAFGIVLIEAMATETPVIASRLPGVRKVFRDKIDGLYVKVASADDLKEKLEKITNNESELLKMGESARKLVLSKYSAQVIEEKLLKFYLSIK